MCIRIEKAVPSDAALILEYLKSALLAAFKCITVNTVTHIHTYNSTANYGHHTVH